MARTVTGVDVGSRTSVFVRGACKGNTFHMTGYAVAEHADPDSAWEGLQLPFKPTSARVGVSGRDVNVRYSRVPRVPDWQLRNLMRFEVEEIGGQSGSEVASDFNLLPEIPEIDGEDVVLLAMARETLLEDQLEGLASVGGTLDSFTPSSVALYNAWLRYGVVQDDVVLVANIGRDNVDVVISRGPDLLFARNVTGGSRLFDEAIAQRLDVAPAQAERIKRELATLRPGARHATPNHERASRALLGAAGQLLSLLQSTVLFCKNQVRVSGLSLDRVVICGGGGRLDGLTQYLAAGMEVQVELFDPFRVVDTSALPPDQADLLARHEAESIVALGLATTASDPDSYSLEILPNRLARSRRFWGRTAWLVAAGVIALLFLGFAAFDDVRRLSAAEQQNQGLSARLRRAVSVHNEAARLVEENAALAELATELWTLAGSGEQVARTLDGLARSLPNEFWVTQLTSEWGHDEELGLRRGAERPIVRVKGAAREGASSPAALHQEFIRALADLVPGARFNQALQQGSTGTTFAVDLTSFAAPEEARDAAEGEGEEG